ncbi:hypothetical protein RhiirB3_395496 [Rhizophagus irregularis]|nr:hypothetical protein RhiirB3_395496 [Rhizophagus irregularis]
MDESSRRFETDETSWKDPQDASKLMKCLGSLFFINLPTELTECQRDFLNNGRPSRRFKTDKTSWKDPQDASELMKRPEGTILDFNMNFGSVHQLRSLNLDFRSVMASFKELSFKTFFFLCFLDTTGSLGFGSVTLLVPIFRIGSVTVPLSPILDLDLDQ